VGRDAARFTFLTRRHDSPLDFDLAVATRQSADNPVFYVQYAHARVSSLFRTAAEHKLAIPSWDQVDFRVAPPRGRAAAHQAAPASIRVFVAGAAQAREPHRVAYYLTEPPASITRTTKPHRVTRNDRR